jgi:Protein of unknown function (DUF4446)
MRESVQLWVALVLAAPGALALIVAIVLWTSLRRTRAAQRALLPDGARVSVVDRQASLQRAMERLEEAVHDLQALVEQQAEATERGLRGALRFQGMVRYDAYRDMGGQQSWSIALLDGTRTGAVVTSLHSRDHARVYLKELTAGVAEQRLSPEEQRAVALALGEPMPGPAEAASAG